MKQPAQVPQRPLPPSVAAAEHRGAPQEGARPARLLFFLLSLLAAAGFAAAPFLIFRMAPLEPVQGLIQKIFYFHVPCAWAMFLSALVCAFGGGAFLFKRRPWGDELCAAAAEVTVLFGVLVLVTGPLWARKAWGHYWLWDVRLTTVFVLFLIFLAVLLARRFGGPARRRIAAGLAIFGAADVPLVYISVKLWRTIHPETTVVTSLPPAMRVAFLTSLVTFTMLCVLLLWVRWGLERSRNQLDELTIIAAERE